jgi:hypothetical protein
MASNAARSQAAVSKPGSKTNDLLIQLSLSGRGGVAAGTPRADPAVTKG